MQLFKSVKHKYRYILKLFNETTLWIPECILFLNNHLNWAIPISTLKQLDEI